MVRAEFSDAKFIQNQHNVGYSKANNIAVQQTVGETLLFLNPDTEIIESAIGVLSGHLDNNPSIGAIGCRVLNSDLTVQRHYLQAFPNLLNQLLDIDVLKRMFPRWELWGMRALYDYTGKPLDVEVISGSCLAVRRTVFQRVRGFTESYFMYGEDLDLSYKIRHAGFGVQYCGEGTVIHHCGKSSELHARRNFEEIMSRESVALFLKRTRSAFYSQIFRYMTGCAALVRLCAVLLLALFGGIIFFREWVFASANKWGRVLGWSAWPREWTRLNSG